MFVILYLFAIIGLLLALQSLVLLAFKEPLQWTFGASSQQPKKLKLALKILLQGTLIGSIFVYPLLIGTTPAAFYGPRFPLRDLPLFFWGQLIALVLMASIFFVEWSRGWIRWKVRWPAKKILSKCFFSGLSSLTVVSVEEPFFRGIILQGMLSAAVPWPVAIPLSAVLFSGAHFIRKVRTYWPAVGLAVLGLWLGVAYYRTGSFWLPMGLHSGGILGIGIHRCFFTYRASERLVGNDVFPIAGIIGMSIMLIGTVVTWFLFSGR